MLRELNKVDRPSELLVWFEYGQDTMSIRKIKQEGFMTVGIYDEFQRIMALPEKDQQDEFAKLPYVIERKIETQLEIKGSLPYEIRDWVWSVERKLRELRAAPPTGRDAGGDPKPADKAEAP